MLDAQHVRAAKKLLGKRLATWRNARKLTQQELAARVHTSRSTVAGVESGAQVVDLTFWSRCEALLRAGGELTTAYQEFQQLQQRHRAERAEAARRTRWGAALVPVPSSLSAQAGVVEVGSDFTISASPPRDVEPQTFEGMQPLLNDVDLSEAAPRADESVGLLDELWEIEERRKNMTLSSIDMAKLNYLEHSARRLIDENERLASGVLAQHARQLRGYVDDLLAARQHPPQRERLYVIAAQLSALLGVAALDLGLWRHARAYGAEAFDLAATIDQPDLQAWTRATQSLIAYYAGDYHDALAYARDGQLRSPRGPQSVRLAINGEARSLARLGDTHGVDEAVERAFALLTELNPATRVSPSLAIDAYCFSRTAANAATAYLALGDAKKVEAHARHALVAFDKAGLRGPQALTRLDLATAALLGSDPDPARACALASRAIEVTSEEGFESVHQRSREFLVTARPWAAEPTVQAVTELIINQQERRALAAAEGIPSQP
jgi:tetratricopeptide (TPR) repeat protein